MYQIPFIKYHFIFRKLINRVVYHLWKSTLCSLKPGRTLDIPTYSNSDGKIISITKKEKKRSFGVTMATAKVQKSCIHVYFHRCLQCLLFRYTQISFPHSFAGSGTHEKCIIFSPFVQNEICPVGTFPVKMKIACLVKFLSLQCINEI